MKTDKTYINEDGAMDFDKFNLLSEEEQLDEMEHWTKKQWIDYRMQDTITEEDCFGPVLELINKYYRD